ISFSPRFEPLTDLTKMSSFVQVDKESHFSYQNLPYGIFSTASDGRKRIGVAIGGFVLDLSRLWSRFKERSGEAESLNALMGLSPEHWSETRTTVKALLSTDDPISVKNEREAFLLPMEG
ncbi:Fumarylacetoacetase, partial [Caligus rogercresseyi]